MFKILGDKIPRKMLKTDVYIGKKSPFKKKNKKEELKATVNFTDLFFAESDIKMINVIFSHQFFKNNFRIYPFRLTGCFLNGIINMILFFRSKNTRQMKKHLDCIKLIFENLTDKIEFFGFYVKLVEKIEKFYEFIESEMDPDNPSNELNIGQLEEKYE
jgi:hypothetical protein